MIEFPFNKGARKDPHYFLFYLYSPFVMYDASNCKYTISVVLTVSLDDLVCRTEMRHKYLIFCLFMR